jgi:predicted RNA-binding Zn ribbon-like protein
MPLAKKYAVPPELALLYEFLNSTDLRTYVEKGEQHIPSDELGTQAQLGSWMRERGLLKKDELVTAADHRRALELRSALRSFLDLAPDSRVAAQRRAEALNRVCVFYPLVVKISQAGTLELKPAIAANGLGLVLAEMFALSDSGRLNRLKMCSSNECQWVFFDRSKPGNRRWCSSLICGNRQKTRDYRKRLQAST